MPALSLSSLSRTPWSTVVSVSPCTLRRAQGPSSLSARKRTPSPPCTRPSPSRAPGRGQPVVRAFVRPGNGERTLLLPLLLLVPRSPSRIGESVRRSRKIAKDSRRRPRRNRDARFGERRVIEGIRDRAISPPPRCIEERGRVSNGERITF